MEEYKIAQGRNNLKQRSFVNGKESKMQFEIIKQEEKTVNKLKQMNGTRNRR